MGKSDQNTGAGGGASASAGAGASADAGADDAALKSILQGLLNSTQAYVNASELIG